MGGIRTSGDLVARVQLAKALKIDEAKKYVAEKLKLSLRDLTDPVLMEEVRLDLGLGRVQPYPENALGMEAKFNIAELLNIKIKSVENFKKKSRIQL
ncbi:dimethylamine methyltransferase [Candidatus Formimonas warabiya]|uniref:Dimethylamine methyltransferase n=1 Tax=Formimonas warabiya TaxID=1761012 RepID=A0A3G1L2P3_FORW1|nr:dimethylamine methyltransferase [Candidatus Formimonas warabiya]